MKKIFFVFLLIHQGLSGQLEKVYNYNFGDNIKNITSKEYSIYVQKEDGIFNIMNQSIFDSKKIKSLCVSPLGNEVLIAEEKRIGLFKIGSQLEELDEVKYDIDFPIQKIIVNTFGTEYFALFSNGNVGIFVKNPLNLALKRRN